MSRPAARLRALVLATILVTSVVAGTVVLTGPAVAIANGSVDIDGLDPSSVDESTSGASHSLDFSVSATDASDATNETYTVSIPDEGTLTAATLDTVQNASGATVTVYNKSVQNDRLIFDTNRSWNGANNNSETIAVNATLTIDWGSVSSTQNEQITVEARDRSPTTDSETVAISINNVQSNVADQGDASLDSGATFWQGQELFFDGSNVVTGGDRTFQLRAWDAGDDEFAGLVTEFTVDATNNTQLIDTDDLDGDYVVTYDGSGVTVNENGVATGTVTEANAGSASWEVAVQTLSASFDADDVPVTAGDAATIEVDSNRGDFTVNVSAEGLDEDDLTEIFNQSADGNAFVAASADDEDDDDSIQVTTAGDGGEIEANFSEFDTAGTYTFDLEVNDTTATTSADATVEERDVTMDFSKGVYTEQEGDVVEITVSMADTDDAFVYVGGEDVNVFERVHLVDDDDDGEAAFSMNLHRAGREGYTQGTGGITHNASTTGDGGVYQIEGDDAFGDVPVIRFNDTDFTNAGADAGDIGIDPQLYEPLEPGDYALVAASENHTAAELLNDDQDAIAVESEEAVATLDVTERSTTGVATLVAPDGDVDLDDDEFEALLADATESGDVAVGDRLLVRVDASGIFGYLNDSLSDAQINALTDGDVGIEGAYLTLEDQAAGANQADTELDDLGDDAEAYTDEENDLFYLVIDTDTAPIEDGDDVAVEFRIGDADTEDTEESFYVDDDEEEVVSAEFSAADADAEFDHVVDDELQVENTAEATVSGTTNVAPNTELTVRLRRSADPAFLVTQEEVVVQSDGTWRTTFDMSALEVGTTFTATVRHGTTTISDEVDGVVVEERTPTPTPEPTTTEPTPAPTTTEPTPEPTTTTGDATTAAGTTTTESDGQPGFGPVVALVALLAAALLAVRRRD